MSGRRRLGRLAAVVLATAALSALALGVGAGRSSRAQPEPPSSPPPASSAEPVAPPARVPASDPFAARPDAAGCYLGVVLPAESVEVLTEVSGRLASVAVRSGEPVAAGEVLATVAVDDLANQLRVEQAAAAEAESTLAELEIAVRQAERQKSRRLALGDLMSQAQVDDAAFELEAAERRRDAAAAALAAARARLDRLGGEVTAATLRAPFAGRVAARYADPGALVAAGTPVVRLVGGGEPRLRFAVPAAEAARFEPGESLRVELDDPRTVLAASLLRVAPEIDAASQRVFAEARLEPAAGGRELPLGALVRVTPSGGPGGATCFGAAGHERNVD